MYIVFQSVRSKNYSCDCLVMNNMDATERRRKIVEMLSSSSEPLKGANLASALGVTRQVVVQDIAVLRAKGENIVATPRGYTYWTDPRKPGVLKIVAVKHDFSQTKKELLAMVKCGVEVIDVIVEHPVYGQLTGQLSICTPEDVESFMQTIEQTQAGLLSSLTDGVHLHTVRASHFEQLSELEKRLGEEGFLIQD